MFLRFKLPLSAWSFESLLKYLTLVESGKIGPNTKFDSMRTRFVDKTLSSDGIYDFPNVFKAWPSGAIYLFQGFMQPLLVTTVFW